MHQVDFPLHSHYAVENQLSYRNILRVFAIWALLVAPMLLTAADKVDRADSSDSTIKRADLDGTNVETLVTRPVGAICAASQLTF